MILRDRKRGVYNFTVCVDKNWQPKDEDYGHAWFKKESKLQLDMTMQKVNLCNLAIQLVGHLFVHLYKLINLNLFVSMQLDLTYSIILNK